MTEGGLFQRWNLTPYILIDFTYLDLKIKNDEKAYLLFHQRKRGVFHFSSWNLTPYVMMYFLIKI